MIRNFLSFACMGMVLSMTSTAFAGGLYFNDRGVRPMARAGAYVAGAEDAGAVWYNPAGLVETKNGVMADGLLPVFVGKFSRTTSYTDPETGQQVEGQEPRIVAKNQKLPLPTFAITHDLGTRRGMFAVGVLTPNAILAEMPGQVTKDGQAAPAPQRYSLISMKGTILANFFVALSGKLPKGFSLGVTGMAIAGQLKLHQMISGCDGFACSFPEDPEFDVDATVRLPVITGGAIAGLMYEYNMLKIGISAMTPYKLKGTAKLHTVLPPAAIFDDATIEGNKADVSLAMPLVLRGGIQVQPWDSLKVEAAVVWEQWSTQDVVKLTPHDMTIRNVTGIGDYEVGDITIQRQMKDVLSFRVGGELAVGRSGLFLLGGFAYENSAFDKNYLSPLTWDGDKYTLSGGIGIDFGRAIRVDMSLTHTFVPPITVTESNIAGPQAIRPEPSTQNIIANGKYTMRNTLLGLGATFYP